VVQEFSLDSIRWEQLYDGTSIADVGVWWTLQDCDKVQQFPLMNCEFYVTVAADNSRSVSTTRFRLLKRLSQSAMAGGLVTGSLIS